MHWYRCSSPSEPHEEPWPALLSPLLAVMYTHFLSLLMGRGLPDAQETKLRRDPSDHLEQHQEEYEAEH